MFTLATVMLPTSSRSPSPKLRGKRNLSPKKFITGGNTKYSHEPIYSSCARSMMGSPDPDKGYYNYEDDNDSNNENFKEEYVYKFKESKLNIASPKKQNNYVKIQRKLVTNLLGSISPRLAKKMNSTNTSDPIWPSSMGTYTRGISMEGIQQMTAPSEPTLSALRVEAYLQEQKELKAALRQLINDASGRHQSTGTTDSSESDDDSDDDFYNDAPVSPTRKRYNKKLKNQLEDKNCGEYNDERNKDNSIILENLISLDSDSNRSTPSFRSCHSPKTDILIRIEESTPSPTQNIHPDEFMDESLENIFGSLSINDVPTLSIEQLSKASINDVRNVHVTSDFIVLETSQIDDTFFV